MPKLPRMTADAIISIFEQKGFVFDRQTGSHKIYGNGANRVTVPFHGVRVLHPKVLKSILADARMSVDDLIEELGK